VAPAFALSALEADASATGSAFSHVNKQPAPLAVSRAPLAARADDRAAYLASAEPKREEGVFRFAAHTERPASGPSAPDEPASRVRTDPPTAPAMLPVAAQAQAPGDTIIVVYSLVDVTATIGTLAPGQSVTLKVDVDINNPWPAGTPAVVAQGTVSGSNFSNVLTDDPSVGGAADPTETPVVDRRQVTTTLAGTAPPNVDAGWRMLSAPVTGLTVDTLAAQNLVQGIPGQYPSHADNVYTTYTGTGWTPAAAGTDPLLPGRGFIWYLFDINLDPPDPDGTSNSYELPRPLHTTGPVANGPVNIPLHTNGDKWNLIGNPWPNPLDVTNLGSWAVGGTLQSSVAQVWDPLAQTYVLTTNRGDSLEVWEGAFIENNTATSLSVPASAQTTGNAAPEAPPALTATPEPTEGAAKADGTEAASLTTETRALAFELRGSDAATGRATLDRAAILYLHPDASPDWDPLDLRKLLPFAQAYALLAFEGERGGATVLKAQESRPFELANVVEIPLNVTAVGTAPTLTLTWPLLRNFPEAWALQLRDEVTGDMVDLRTDSSYTFSFEAAARRTGGLEGLLAEGPHSASKTTDARFTLILSPFGPTGTEGELPAVFAFTGLYPNPARGAATVAYDVPTASAVEVEVFDLLGRRVAILADGDKAPGRHRVAFPASSLPSGTYLVRLRAAPANGEPAFVQTRRLTLVR
ncbi:MAG TPA: T9SS type A sorting domain-containing protein, partial [Rubricoccaceae bacterium]|nr:T9SS type A sorting domain-containing protein [Rubricoccaceae bacterium]